MDAHTCACRLPWLPLLMLLMLLLPQPQPQPQRLCVEGSRGSPGALLLLMGPGCLPLLLLLAMLLLLLMLNMWAVLWARRRLCCRRVGWGHGRERAHGPRWTPRWWSEARGSEAGWLACSILLWRVAVGWWGPPAQEW